MPFDQDLATFRRELPKLLENKDNLGKFVLINKDGVSGVWTTFDEALAAGYERFGVDPFLVKQIVEQEQAIFFSRRVTPCH